MQMAKMFLLSHYRIWILLSLICALGINTSVSQEICKDAQGEDEECDAGKLNCGVSSDGKPTGCVPNEECEVENSDIVACASDANKCCCEASDVPCNDKRGICAAPEFDGVIADCKDDSTEEVTEKPNTGSGNGNTGNGNTENSNAGNTNAGNGNTVKEKTTDNDAKPSKKRTKIDNHIIVMRFKSVCILWLIPVYDDGSGAVVFVPSSIRILLIPLVFLGAYTLLSHP